MAKLAIPKHWPIKERDSYWPIAKVVPYEKNPRTHPPAQVTLLAGLIKSFGPDQHIVVDEDAIILKGHGRRLAALEAGMEWFPVVQRFGLSEDDKRAMRIADNQVTLLAGWDRTLIYGEVMSLKGSGYDVSLLGFGEAQLVQFTTTPAPPAQFMTFGEELPTEFQCPQCKYAWSGKPKPTADNSKNENDSLQVRVPPAVNSRRRSRSAEAVPSGASLARKKASRKN